MRPSAAFQLNVTMKEIKGAAASLPKHKVVVVVVVVVAAAALAARA